ncbi:MAG: hypothetical protein R3E01_25115 [Pirellulaceae bacterium]
MKAAGRKDNRVAELMATINATRIAPPCPTVLAIFPDFAVARRTIGLGTRLELCGVCC